MLNVNTIAASAEERVLTGVKVGQALAIDGLRNALSVADRVVPTNVSQRVEGRVQALPDASNVVEGVFGFAGKLLEAQRDFVGEVVDIIQPAPPAPKKAAPKAKAAPKKKSTRKSTKKAA